MDPWGSTRGTPGSTPAQPFSKCQPSARKRHTDILRTATLHTARISCRTIRIGLVAILFSNFSVLLWIRIHDHTNHAEFLRSLNLETPEDATIFCKSNLALERHVGRNEILKVLESPEIDVHVRRSNISTG